MSKKGGSLASDNVMNNMSNNVDESVSYPEATPSVITAKDIVQNYGTNYKTTGGSLFGLEKIDIKGFTKKLVDNRVLDMYLKYMGIKTLTTVTLVPMALIMGRDLFESTIKQIKESDQSGGNFLDDKIPVLDDNLIGNYLKIAGLTALNLSPATLVPLGVLMIIYDLYFNEQTGGRVLLPPKYFNPEKPETYVDNLPEHGSSNPNPPTTEQTGGTKLITGATNPANLIQKIDQVITGQKDICGSSETNVANNSNMNTTESVFKPLEVEVQSIGSFTEGPTGVKHTLIPAQTDDTAAVESTSVDATHPNEEVVKSDLSVSMAGGGSDWASSQMSRGPVNAPGMDESQFRMFTKTADYISNKQLAMGAADQWKAAPGSEHQTLYEQTPSYGSPSGSNTSGLSTQQFGSGHGEGYIEGDNLKMGPNDLLVDRRDGYADVSTSSAKVRATVGGSRLSTETRELFQNFLDDNASQSGGESDSDSEMVGGATLSTETRELFQNFLDNN